MPYMQPETTFGLFAQIEDLNGTTSVPLEYFTLEDHCQLAKKGDSASIEIIEGWFARLSASGFIDCTEWSGPYATEEEAIKELTDMYGDEDKDSEDEDSEEETN